MRLIVSISIFILLLKDSETRIYEPCRLAKELYYVYGISLEEIPYWLCTIDDRAAYNTSLVIKLGSVKTHGLFQVPELDGNLAGVIPSHCQHNGGSAMSDDNISDDVKCTMTNMERLGVAARDLFHIACKHNDPSIYLYGCNI